MPEFSQQLQTLSKLMDNEQYKIARKLVSKMVLPDHQRLETTDLDKYYFYIGLLSSYLDVLSDTSSFRKALAQPIVNPCIAALSHNRIALIEISLGNFDAADREIAEGLAILTARNNEERVCALELLNTRLSLLMRLNKWSQVRSELKTLIVDFLEENVAVKRQFIRTLLQTIFEAESHAGNFQLARESLIKAYELSFILGAQHSVQHAEILLLLSSISAVPAESITLLQESIKIYQLHFGFCRGTTRWLLLKLAEKQQFIGLAANASQTFRKIIRIEKLSQQQNLTDYCHQRMAELGISKWQILKG